MKTLHTTCEFADAGTGRVDRVVQQLTGLSRAGVRGLIDHGCVSVNGSACEDPAARAVSGDTVQVRYDPQQKYKERLAPKPDPAYTILHEDEHLIVVDKAAHVLTVPTAKDEGSTLVAALERYINRGKGRRRIHVVHRLDRGTSGVLVFGNSHDIASQIKDQFEARKPERIYIAIVAGTLEHKEGTFRTHLATDMNLNRYSTKKRDKGQLAITHYRVENHAKDATVIKVWLETGRRNQIRVHFAEAGHPVLGDPRYRSDLSQHPRWKAKRLALHAMSLAFTHPVTGKVMRFEAPLPTPFEPFVRRGASRSGRPRRESR